MLVSCKSCFTKVYSDDKSQSLIGYQHSLSSVASSVLSLNNNAVFVALSWWSNNEKATVPSQIPVSYIHGVVTSDKSQNTNKKEIKKAAVHHHLFLELYLDNSCFGNYHHWNMIQGKCVYAFGRSLQRTIAANLITSVHVERVVEGSYEQTSHLGLESLREVRKQVIVEHWPLCMQDCVHVFVSRVWL